jgi:type VI secretion system protein ImpM
MSAPAAVRVGFFGKIPSRGDFVRAGLSRQFVQAWDDWVQAVLPGCRSLLGDGWDAAWRAAASWRFVLPGGQCGAHPVLGLFLPSLDGAARCFPLTIAAEGAEDGIAFLDAAEAIGREAAGGALVPDALLARLAALVPPAPAKRQMAAACWWQGHRADEAITLHGLPGADALAGMLRR